MPELSEEQGATLEAVEASRLFSPYRLQVARQARGLTKKDLAEQLGISSAALSQFELGQNRPSPATVSKLSNALDYDPAFFSSTTVQSSQITADDESVDTYGHFRSLRSVTATRRRQVLTVAHLVRDVTEHLETLVKLPDLAIPRLSATGEDEIVRAAAQAREAFGIDADSPIVDVLRLLERHGVVTARYAMEASDVSAFSVPAPLRVYLILKRSRQVKKDRDRFSTCHELGHLVLHQAGKGLASKALEDEANQFASAFLMPEAGIRDQLPSRADWPRLLQLKQHWGVSMSALLRRSKSLGVMSDATYTQAMRTISTRGWRVDEPGTVNAVESPALLGIAMSTAGLTPADVSAAIGWPVDDIAKLLAESADPRPAVQI